MKKVVVVGSSWCSGCTALKKQLDANGIVYEVMDGDTDEGMTFCQYHKIRSLPTTLVIDEDHHLVATIVGNKYGEIVNAL